MKKQNNKTTKNSSELQSEAQKKIALNLARELDLLTKQEAGEMLGFSPVYLLRLARLGKIVRKDKSIGCVKIVNRFNVGQRGLVLFYKDIESIGEVKNQPNRVNRHRRETGVTTIQVLEDSGAWEEWSRPFPSKEQALEWHEKTKYTWTQSGLKFRAVVFKKNSREKDIIELF